MEHRIRIIVFISFIAYMILGLIISIPAIINNIIYGIMSIIAIFFLLTNKQSLGLDNMFKKEDEEIK